MYLILLLFLLSPPTSSKFPTIGVTYRPQPPPAVSEVVPALRSAGIRHVIIEDPTPSSLRPFLYSGISVILSVPGPNLLPFNSTASAAVWLSDHVLPFHPRVNISAIALGRGVISPAPLFPAIRNLASALADLGLPPFPISTVNPFGVLDPSFPPSEARFQEFLFEPYFKPLLEMLSRMGSPFLIDLYPFWIYRNDPNIPIGFAMFEAGEFAFRDDPKTGLRYRNLFDEMVDATLSALARSGHRRMPVVVTGTGWPTAGDSTAATVEYAAKYNGGLLKHLRGGMGTPMKRDFGVKAVYVHELFDEMRSSWGIWYKNLTAKYELELSGSSESGELVLLGFWCWFLVMVFEIA